MMYKSQPIRFHCDHHVTILFQNEAHTNELLAAACAVGVSSNFAAPIGGIEDIVYLPIYISFSLYLHLSIYLSIYLSPYLSIYLIHLSLSLSIYLFICLST